VPCTITAFSAISKMTAEVGGSTSRTHNVISYSNPESNTTHCGAITITVIGS
jgi:hypothetical protein